MSKPIITMIGRLTRDPEAAGKNGIKFSVACDKGKDSADFYNVVVWSDTLKGFINKWVKKGSLVQVSGTVELNKVEGKGTFVNVTAHDVQFGPSSGKKKDGDAPAKVEEKTEDDIDF